MERVVTDLVGKMIEIYRFDSGEHWPEASGVVRIVSVSKSLYLTIEFSDTHWRVEDRGTLRTYDVLDSSIAIKPVQEPVQEPTPDPEPELDWRAIAIDFSEMLIAGGMSATVIETVVRKHTK